MWKIPEWVQMHVVAVRLRIPEWVQMHVVAVGWKSVGVGMIVMMEIAMENLVMTSRLVECPVYFGCHRLKGSKRHRRHPAPFLQWDQYCLDNPDEGWIFPGCSRNCHHCCSWSDWVHPCQISNNDVLCRMGDPFSYVLENFASASGHNVIDFSPPTDQQIKSHHQI